jgi:hypothetical protein
VSPYTNLPFEETPCYGNPPPFNGNPFPFVETIFKKQGMFEKNELGFSCFLICSKIF